MKSKIKIANKAIGENSPVFIIAEAGVNHNGKLSLAKKLIIAAKRAGADAIKFQAFSADELVTPTAPLAAYQKKNFKKEQKQLQMLQKLELSRHDFIELKKFADQKKIMLLVTPHTQKAVIEIKDLVPAFKIGSADLTNLQLLETAARYQKPMLISTGMATLKEIEVAIKSIAKAKNNKIILLHCTTNYPCDLKEVNLKAMQTIAEKFARIVGYSDHTIGTQTAVMATTLGAKVIEKLIAGKRRLAEWHVLMITPALSPIWHPIPLSTPPELFLQLTVGLRVGKHGDDISTS